MIYVFVAVMLVADYADSLNIAFNKFKEKYL